MKNSQPLVELIHKLRKEHQHPTTPSKLENARLADSLVKSVSGGTSKSIDFFARWNRAA